MQKASTRLAILAWICASAAHGNTIGVTNTNDSGPGSLRSAIATAASGDTIVFSPKAIRLPATIAVSSTLAINQNLTILGPGAPLLAISGGNAVEVLNIGIAVVSISGLTVQNGNIRVGGGISNAGILTLGSDTVSGNSAVYGGGIFNSGMLSLNNSIVSGNYSEFGGAIYNQGTLAVSHGTFATNSASLGGGIFNNGFFKSATSTLLDSTLAGNSAVNGGAIFNQGGAFNPFGGSGTLILNGCTLSANDAAFSGGGIYNATGTVTVQNTTLSGNFTGYDGGAIYNAGSLTLSNGTLSGNSAHTGGGISNYASVSLKNAIIADSAMGENCYVPFPVFVSLGYNLSDDTTCAAFFNQPGDMNSTSAGLDPAGLKDNGGPTPTSALLPTSPAVDAIPLAACTDIAGNPVTTDQRGVTRPQGRACDIGAFELVPIGAGLPLGVSEITRGTKTNMPAY